MKDCNKFLQTTFANQLERNKIIQKFIAAFLLLIFSISAAPKIYFHDLIADHKDYSGCNDFHKNLVLHKEGYNCHFDDLVVSSPFIIQAEKVITPVSVYFDKPPVSLHSYFHSAFAKQLDNRGPPPFQSFVLS